MVHYSNLSAIDKPVKPQITEDATVAISTVVPLSDINGVADDTAPR